jgi:hypothetical protein
MAKQPTATAFTRTQESWANHVLEKVRKEIEERESLLRRNDIPIELWDDDDDLMEMYDDELFFERYAEEMARQRAYIKEKYLGG